MCWIDALVKFITRFFSNLFLLMMQQIWRRSRRTSTPSGMELPHMAVEALVRNIWDRTFFCTCIIWICEYGRNKDVLSDWTVVPSRPGESLYAVLGSPQRASDLHVPTWPQAPDALNLQPRSRCWWWETILIHNPQNGEYRSYCHPMTLTCHYD